MWGVRRRGLPPSRVAPFARPIRTWAGVGWVRVCMQGCATVACPSRAAPFAQPVHVWAGVGRATVCTQGGATVACPLRAALLGAAQQHNRELNIENNREVKCISKRLIHV
jgi:hypothetical protein